MASSKHGGNLHHAVTYTCLNQQLAVLEMQSHNRRRKQLFRCPLHAVKEDILQPEVAFVQIDFGGNLGDILHMSGTPEFVDRDSAPQKMMDLGVSSQ